MSQQTFTEEMRQTTLRDACREKNREALLGLMQKHGLYISAKDFHLWRPTALSSGDIPGVALGVTIIATNGILAYFVSDDSSVPVLCGHTQCFTGKVGPLYSTSESRVAAKLTKKRMTPVEKALKVLADLIVKQ